MNYIWAFPYIPFKEVGVVFEIGSRDLLDAYTIQPVYACKVYSFECNPEGISQCKQLQEIVPNENITLIEKAISQTDGEITFYPFDKEKYDNIGASSIFEIDFTTTRSKTDIDYGRGHVQKKITVPSIRLDTFCKEINLYPDVIFMDVQEAELEVLKSAGDFLKEIKYIVTEISTCPTYKGGCDIVELNEYLEQQGFEIISHDKSIVARTETFGFLDVIYANKFRDSITPK